MLNRPKYLICSGPEDLLEVTFIFVRTTVTSFGDFVASTSSNSLSTAWEGNGASSMRALWREHFLRTNLTNIGEKCVLFYSKICYRFLPPLVMFTLDLQKTQTGD
ncbi:unnamed protein product [Victoria cruziana]